MNAKMSVFAGFNFYIICLNTYFNDLHSTTMNKFLPPFGKCIVLAVIILIAPRLLAQNFSTSSLQGENLKSPTSLQFGPDDRLYVAQQDGLILAYTIQRNTNTNYQITATETISNIKQIQNHNDDGTLNNLAKRQVTGILVTGTPNNIAIYVGSSDSRIGGGSSNGDVNLDTNSGMISRLTKSGNNWQRLDLVRGLPRSEENHANNGMQLKGDLLYVAQGGNTNAGSPSNNFAFSCEYALSGAILTVNIPAIDAMSTKTASDGSQYKYDLPTLDDPTRPNQNGQDVGDPFGGNDGLNQAKVVPNGPVQIYASGFRNIYDVLWTEDNRLYTWDNGANGGWGGHPANEGFGTATNNWVPGEPGSNGSGPNDGQVNNQDGLHFVNSNNYYGGHPNPIRANPNGAGLFYHDASLGSGGNVGVWRTSTGGANPLPQDWPPVPSNLANPIEGDYQNPGVDDPSIYTVNNSTNGLAEYTASNFNNAMKGNLIAASFKGPLYRVQRNNSGGINSTSSVTTLAENFGALPLDVIAQGDNDPFPGTIWVANLGSDNISVFEPQDFGGCGGGNNSDDEDGDQYTNNDELANGTDPCNAASMPADFDKSFIGGFLVSNLNDPDDDDDGINDNVDAFVWDAQNGSTTNIPVDYPLLNADPGFGFFGLGFTGLMSNGSTDYLNLIQDEDNSNTEIIAGGAVGLLTFNNVPKGDPYTNNNTQQNGFQFGVNVNQNTQPFVYEGRLLGPIFISTPQQYQSAGIFIGTGDQSNYLKVVVNGNGATTGIQILYEESNAVASNQQANINNIGFESEVRLFIQVTPATGQVQVQYAVGNGTPQNIGQPVQLQGNVLNAVQSNQSLAVGIINTSISATSTFNATYDNLSVKFIENTPPPPSNIGNWVNIDDGTSCSGFGQSGSCAQGRHEAAYVQVGNKFYLLGGRENDSNVNIYNPATDSWTIGADAPFPVHHAQALEYDGLIYMVGAFQDNNFPNENPNPNIVIYDPLADQWLTGPAIPNNRLRGSMGAVVYQDKIYVVNGLTNGHSSGWVNWFDVFDPRTNQWSTLPNSPRARDHFHAAVIGDKLYVAGGRRSGQQNTFLPTVGEVDVFNFQTNSWSTLPNNIPTQRAASTTAVLGSELIIIGGEQSSGLANNQTEALNVSTNNWRTLAPMLQGRHGTQAIVNNNGIYVASGSPNVGGGDTRTQEAFFFGNQTTPTGNAITASTLTTSANTLNFTSNNTSQNLTLTNTNGTQAILIQGISDNSNAFSANIATGLPLHLPPGGSATVAVSFSSGNNTSGQLTIQHTGNNAPSSIVNLTASDNPPNGTVTEDCNGNTIEHGNGTITLISGGNASFFKIFDENWQYIDNCGYNCGSSFTVSGLQAGKYRVFFEDSNYQPICDKLITLGGGGNNDPDNDGDGFPQSEDCNDNDPNLTIIGASCNDGNANTTDDVVQSNCTCVGTPTGGGGIVNEDCNGNTISHGNGTITLISGGNASFFKIFDENWQYIDNCGYNCGTSFTVNGLPSGKYRVFFEDSNYQPICDKLITLGSGGNPPPSGNAIYINAGGPAVNVGGINWGADQYFSGGSTYNIGGAIANTTSDVIYQTERYAGGNISYNVPVTNGTYEVQLHFAEIFFVDGNGGTGKRVFNISLEGQNVLNNYDINAVTGANVPTANIQIFNVTVNDGTLNINLNGIVENPKISAIAILPASSSRSNASGFEAFAVKGRKVRLNWVYSQINRPLHYEIEYAKGKDNYQLLSVVEAESTTDVEAYGILHEQPVVGDNTYQIKVVFSGGAYQYIDPEIVEFEGTEELLTVFPNPTKGQLFVDLTNYQGAAVRLSMININGVEVLRRQLTQDHSTIAELDISLFENGFYMIQAKVDGRRLVSQKVMLLRQY